MQEFPKSLSSENTLQFSDLLKDYYLQQMRQDIYIHILRNNQNDFFDIELFDRKYVKDIKVTDKFIEIMINELEQLGWKTFLGYGGTGLFIYDKEKPASAW
jgi:NAD-specific glutamate dehydrogenase